MKLLMRSIKKLLYMVGSSINRMKEEGDRQCKGYKYRIKSCWKNKSRKKELKLKKLNVKN